MNSSHTRFIALVTVTYVVLGSAWVLLSDQLLPAVQGAALVWLSGAKGVFFVLCSAAGYVLAMRAVLGIRGQGQRLFEIAAQGLSPGNAHDWYHYPLALVLVGAMLAVRVHLGGAAGSPPLLILFVLPIV